MALSRSLRPTLSSIKSTDSLNGVVAGAQGWLSSANGSGGGGGGIGPARRFTERAGPARVVAEDHSAPPRMLKPSKSTPGLDAFALRDTNTSEFNGPQRIPREEARVIGEAVSVLRRAVRVPVQPQPDSVHKSPPPVHRSPPPPARHDRETQPSQGDFKAQRTTALPTALKTGTRRNDMMSQSASVDSLPSASSTSSTSHRSSIQDDLFFSGFLPEFPEIQKMIRNSDWPNRVSGMQALGHFVATSSQEIRSRLPRITELFVLGFSDSHVKVVQAAGNAVLMCMERIAQFDNEPAGGLCQDFLDHVLPLFASWGFQPVIMRTKASMAESGQKIADAFRYHFRGEPLLTALAGALNNPEWTQNVRVKQGVLAFIAEFPAEQWIMFLRKPSNGRLMLTRLALVSGDKLDAPTQRLLKIAISTMYNGNPDALHSAWNALKANDRALLNKLFGVPNLMEDTSVLNSVYASRGTSSPSTGYRIGTPSRTPTSRSSSPRPKSRSGSPHPTLYTNTSPPGPRSGGASPSVRKIGGGSVSSPSPLTISPRGSSMTASPTRVPGLSWKGSGEQRSPAAGGGTLAYRSPPGPPGSPPSNMSTGVTGQQSRLPRAFTVVKGNGAGSNGHGLSRIATAYESDSDAGGSPATPTVPNGLGLTGRVRRGSEIQTPVSAIGPVDKMVEMLGQDQITDETFPTNSDMDDEDLLADGGVVEVVRTDENGGVAPQPTRKAWGTYSWDSRTLDADKLRELLIFTEETLTSDSRPPRDDDLDMVREGSLTPRALRARETEAEMAVASSPRGMAAASAGAIPQVIKEFMWKRGMRGTDEMPEGLDAFLDIIRRRRESLFMERATDVLSAILEAVRDSGSSGNPSLVQNSLVLLKELIIHQSRSLQPHAAAILQTVLQCETAVGFTAEDLLEIAAEIDLILEAFERHFSTEVVISSAVASLRSEVRGDRLCFGMLARTAQRSPEKVGSIAWEDVDGEDGDGEMIAGFMAKRLVEVSSTLSCFSSLIYPFIRRDCSRGRPRRGKQRSIVHWRSTRRLARRLGWSSCRRYRYEPAKRERRL
ncbi:hypothetical protein BJ742DRAFT_537186 [Cladochytrium replicatum]|nr:hypothetical protein BJ742DRAFT_537186 [Cladochytrium replicatum]